MTSSTLASVIKKGIESHIKELHTSIPGIIESFDPEKQLASIQPAVKRIFKTTEQDKEILTPSDLPILINVPVVFPRGGGFSLTFPVKKGDECLLVFCERSIDNWHNTGKIEIPGARRFHALSDATAFVGISSLVNKVPDYSATDTQLKKDDGSVYISLKEDKTLDIHAEGDITATTDADIVANCKNLKVTATDDIIADCKNITVEATTQAELTSPIIKLNGNTTIDGTLDVTGVTTAPTVAATSSLTVAGKEMKEHTHIGSPTAPSGAISDTGAPK